MYGALIVCVLFFLSLGKGAGRVSQINIFNIPEGTVQLKQAMDEEGTLNPLLTRFYDNKLFFYGRLFSTFYSEHLSLDFLFVNNGLPIRYKIPFTGNLYPIEAPFLLLGFVFFLSEGIKSKKYHYLIPIFWLLIAPVPAALTWEDLPNIQRSSFMIPSLVIITSFGFYESLKLIKNIKIKKIMVVLIIAVLLQNFLYFQHNYFWRLKVHEPWHRSASEKDLIFTLTSLSRQYKKIVMTTDWNNNLIFYLFYLKFDPSLFQKLGSPREKNGLKFQIKSQLFVFETNPCPILDADLKHINRYKDTLFVVKSDNCQIPKQGEIIKTIYTPDGVPAFNLVRLHEIEG